MCYTLPPALFWSCQAASTAKTLLIHEPRGEPTQYSRRGEPFPLCHATTSLSSFRDVRTSRKVLDQQPKLRRRFLSLRGGASYNGLNE